MDLEDFYHDRIGTTIIIIRISILSDIILTTDQNVRNKTESEKFDRINLSDLNSDKWDYVTVVYSCIMLKVKRWSGYKENKIDSYINLLLTYVDFLVNLKEIDFLGKRE